MFDDNGNNKPVAVIKDSIQPSISCSIFEREGEYGKWYTVAGPQISKNVGKKTGVDEWKYFQSFSASEIPGAIRVLNEALNKIGELMTRERQLKRETNATIQTGKQYASGTGTYDDFEDGEII